MMQCLRHLTRCSSIAAAAAAAVVVSQTLPGWSELLSAWGLQVSIDRAPTAADHSTQTRRPCWTQMRDASVLVMQRLSSPYSTLHLLTTLPYNKRTSIHFSTNAFYTKTQTPCALICCTTCCTTSCTLIHYKMYGTGPYQTEDLQRIRSFPCNMSK